MPPELDRRLSPRFPTTEEAAKRRRYRQRRAGSVYIALFGCAVALGLSSIPVLNWVGYVGGGALIGSACMFFGYDYFTRERT